MAVPASISILPRTDSSCVTRRARTVPSADIPVATSAKVSSFWSASMSSSGRPLYFMGA